MRFNRRSFMLGTGAIVTSLSGCLDRVTTDTQTVNLTLRNYTSETQPLKIKILREDADSYNNGLDFEREFEVSPPEGDESAGVIREPNIVQQRRYLIRVLLRNGKGEWQHHHFYPGESERSSESEEFDIRIYREEETDALYVRFM